MHFSPILFLFLTVVRYGSTMDGILVTSVGVHVDDTQLGCGSVKLLIENVQSAPNCLKDGTQLLLVYNGTSPIENSGNLTLLLEVVTLDDQKKTIGLNFSGLLIPDRTSQNLLHTENVDLKLDTTVTTVGTTVAPTTVATTVVPTTVESTSTTVTTTTVKPKEKGAKLTVNYLHLQYSEDCKTVKQNKNGGAVAVAIIEGLVLIAILAYFGYKTMVDQKRKQSAAVFGAYDNNNSRITVTDSIRMSDIPPARTTVPPTVPTVTQQPIRAELVAPGNTNPQQPNPNQFADPFASLDSW